MRAIGIDIGGTKCALTYGESEKNRILILERRTFSTQDYTSAEGLMEKFFQETDVLFAKFKMAEAIGISCGGPLDSKNGTILTPPHLPALHQVKIKQAFEQRYPIPCHLQNDANACALAEWRYGAGGLCRNMVFLTFGTGLGAGLILDGKLYEGTNGNAGEVGHIRLSDYGPAGYGKIGSFEGFCSGKGIAQLGYLLALQAYQQGICPTYFQPGHSLENITAQSIANAARQDKDPTALEVYRICGEWLGRGLSMIVDFLNPEKIVLGSIFERSGDLLWASCRQAMEQEALEAPRSCCEVVPAALGDRIGDYAALSVAIDMQE